MNYYYLLCLLLCDFVECALLGCVVQKKLQNMTCESKLLSSDIASRREMLVKIEEETEQAEEVGLLVTLSPIL